MDYGFSVSLKDRLSASPGPFYRRHHGTRRTVGTPRFIKRSACINRTAMMSCIKAFARFIWTQAGTGTP